MSKERRFDTGSSTARWVLRGVGVLGAAGLFTAGCLDRPVATTEPRTTNLYVDTIPRSGINKIDLLFMIDNSVSMFDKQEILRQAVPVLVERLVRPTCRENGTVVGSVGPDGRCATGDPEFQPIDDIHLGVVTSSLGSHGGDECLPTAMDATTGRTPDDRAELVPSARPAAALASWNQSGFLVWDPDQEHVPPGETDVTQLIQHFSAHVAAAGENGCGYEGSLESWYRFLVDPEPPVDVTKAGGLAVKGPINQRLLDQRSAFLRPDSLLVIVMLSDENDCSIIDEDGTQGHFVSSRGRMPRASSSCARDPNDPCCHTCGVPAPEGCPSNAEDAECSKPTTGSYPTLSAAEDHNNLRCFDQRRRFGMDLLYPVDRYVRALTESTVPNRAGALVPNPIFSAPPGVTPRDKSHVILAGLVGVPWQDVADSASLDGVGLTYLSAAELEQAGRFSLMLGNPDTGAPPADPLMRESVEPRSGVHPLLNVPVAPATSTNPRENPINGHEQNVVAFDDLQFACTFELQAERPCTESNSAACDCNAGESAYNSPLCAYPNGPNAEGVQRFAKAYPGRRQLEVLRGVADNGIVASICPKHIAPAPGLLPAQDPNYGYNPAIASLLELIGLRLPGQCLPRELAPAEVGANDAGQVPCAVVEALPSATGACACDRSRGRGGVSSDDLERAVLEQLAANGQCGGRSGLACSAYCLCEIEQFSGAELGSCQSGSNDPSLFGYCYIDEAQGIGNPSLLEGCPSTERRLLRFVGNDLPAPTATTFVACFGATLSDD